MPPIPLKELEDEGTARRGGLHKALTGVPVDRAWARQVDARCSAIHTCAVRCAWQSTAMTGESYSICYNRLMATELAKVARHAAEVMAQARSELVRAVRQAAAQGMTQSEIARQIGRSQPEVSRLLRFHGTSPLARNLRRNADQIRQLVGKVGGTQVRVFGSVAVGEDQPGSDVDLLFVMTKPLSLMQLGRLEQQVADLLDAPVGLVPESALRPDLRERVCSEAVLL